MKVGIFTPAYREQVHVQHAYMVARLCVDLVSAGVRPDPFYRASACLDASRNWAVHEARRRECQFLLMADADVYTVEPAFLERMLGMLRDNVAVVGAAVMGRDGRENTTADGCVGTGIMAIDLRRLSRLPMPWFHTDLDELGQVATGEDIAFCRHVRTHGFDVAIARSFPTSHVGDAHHHFSPAAAVTAAPRDGAPHCAVETSNG